MAVPPGKNLHGVFGIQVKPPKCNTGLRREHPERDKV
jgi:hypothetical protein